MNVVRVPLSCQGSLTSGWRCGKYVPFTSTDSAGSSGFLPARAMSDYSLPHFLNNRLLQWLANPNVYTNNCHYVFSRYRAAIARIRHIEADCSIHSQTVSATSMYKTPSVRRQLHDLIDLGSIPATPSRSTLSTKGSILADPFLYAPTKGSIPGAVGHRWGSIPPTETLVVLTLVILSRYHVY